jgi:hypothetical protein
MVRVLLRGVMVSGQEINMLVNGKMTIEQARELIPFPMAQSMLALGKIIN